MKKKLLPVLACIFLALNSNAQVEIRFGNSGSTPDISGTEHVEIVSSDQLVSVVFQVKNTSAASHNYIIKRDRLIELPIWTDSFCWAICYNAGSMNSNSWTAPDPFTIGANGAQLLIVDTDTHGSGTELYRYYVINQDNSMIEDSVDLRITSVLGLKDQEEESVSVYPNPVSTILTVNTTGLEESVELKMVDLLGNVVLSGSGTQMNKMDVSNFRNGVYLVFIYNKGDVVLTERIVIKH